MIVSLLAVAGAFVLPSAHRPRPPARCRTPVAAADVTDRPDPAILVSARPLSEQQFAFSAISTGVAAGASVATALLAHVDAFTDKAPVLLPLPLGLAFFVAGISHFTLKDLFVRITPPRGTWGFWAAPAPGAELLGLSYEEYHVYWTGVAEVIGGGALALAALGVVPIPQQAPAALCGLLTAAVTPANIFQFTHDRPLRPEIPIDIPYPSGHAARGVIQMVLIAVWWGLATLPSPPAA